MLTSIENYLSINPNLGKTLYYPGAGADVSPLKLFVENSSISEVHYADYSSHQMTKIILEESLGEGWSVEMIKDLHPQDLGQDTWDEFWYAGPNSQRFQNPSTAYGIHFSLISPKGKKAQLFYWGTEAIKTYYLLLINGIIPNIIVLQDHGFGGNWSIFGTSKSKMYGIAKVENYMPEILFVSKEGIGNGGCWPEYEAMTEYERLDQSEAHERAIFRKS